MKLSAALIFSKHSQLIEEELRKLEPYFDEFVIATQDRTWIKREKNKRRRLFYYPWQDDFAHARNWIAEKIKGDYYMWWDSDDKVLNADRLPELKELIEKENLDWIDLEYLYERDEAGNIIMRHWKPRIIRRGTGIWRKSVHESLEPAEAVKQIRSDLVIIDHQIKNRVDHTKASGERNLRILLKEFEQTKEKPDPRTLFYIGNTLMGLEKFGEAIPFYMDHVKLCGWPEEKYYSLHYVAKSLLQLGRFDEAINISLEATKIKPDWPLAYFDLAEAYNAKEDFPKGIEWSLIGLERKRQEAHSYFIDDTEFELWPLVRLAAAYLAVHSFTLAQQIVAGLKRKYPKVIKVQELAELTKTVHEGEEFVRSFIYVTNTIRQKDRVKAAQLYDCLPSDLDGDIRLQQTRKIVVPPRSWRPDEIVIYCGAGNGATWAPPSIYTGVGGSETAVIRMSEELTKLGWKVTVYNSCAEMQGNYQDVKYLPYYHFNERDDFNVLIAWRNPLLFDLELLRAEQKIVWLHDIAYPQQFTKRSIEKTDRFIFLSLWHRQNMPSIPEEKIFISNNGINPADFVDLPKKEKNVLFWGASYDRGLLTLIKDILPQIRREISDLKLEICYGWDNIDLEIKKSPGIYPQLEQLRRELTPLLDQSWIVHHGRIGQRQLAQVMGRAVVYPYSSEFGETNNITSQSCQAAGCFVVTTSQAGGTPEKVVFGKVIKGEGIYTDKKLQKQFARVIIDYLKNLKSSTKDSKIANAELIKHFSWAETAKNWQRYLLWTESRHIRQIKTITR